MVYIQGGKMQQRRITLDICLIAMFVAILAVCAWISFPVGEIKYTLQVLGVLLAGGLLGAKRGVIALAAYLMLGLLGVPVFAGFMAGITFTTGYTIGFLFTALCAGLARRFDGLGMIARVAVTVLLYCLGVLLCYAFGTGYVMVVHAYPLENALLVCVLPYLWFDGVKIVLAVLLVERLKRYVK